jgi:hypothetical protein
MATASDPLARSLCALLACLALDGCIATCADNCHGCCDSNGTCVAGSTNDSCGSGGTSCTTCAGTGVACVTGLCLHPAIISGPATIDFGMVGVNTQSQQTVTLTNSGGLSLQITMVAFDGGETMNFAAEPIPDAPIDLQKTIDVTFDFAPTTLGFFSTNATLVSNAVPPYSVELSGQGY